MNYSTLTLAQLKKIAAEKGITPAGDKRKRQTWIDALSSFNIDAWTAELDAYFDADLEVIQAEQDIIASATQNGDRPIVLSHYKGHAQFEKLLDAAVAEAVENNKLYEELLKRATELNMEISFEWKDLHDGEIVSTKDELWASLNARLRKLGL